jgi:Fic family protein
MVKAAINTRLGSYVSRSTTGEAYKAYVPASLPPQPPLDMDGLYKSLDQAMKALGGLDALAKLLPDISMFLYMYVRKEALVSSQIEGTQSSLSDLLLFENDENPGVPVDDVEEVSNYIAALNHGLGRMKKGFPLSTRLIREMHKILLRGVRGANKASGEFRRSQNWIGGIRPGKARFVPPPPEMVDDLMSDLEKFAHDEDQKLPALVKAALIHVQFETIHPFLDGNGRVGRLLITLLLCHDGVIPQPLLYLSLYLKKNRARYYELLQHVRETGDWETWINFFLTGVDETARQAADTVARLLQLFQADRDRIYALGRAAGSAPRVHEFMQRQPVVTAARLVTALGLSKPTANAALSQLVKLGVAEEITGQTRSRIYSYPAHLRILGEGTEPV